MTKMSSGQRIVKAADDAAGLAISEKLKSKVRSLDQASRNANDGISMIQTAEGGLNEIHNMLNRLRELSIQSASDTMGKDERKFADLEYQNLKKEMQRISKVTEFNGHALLDGSHENYDFQIGINNDQFEDRIQYRSDFVVATLDSLGVADLQVQDKAGSQDALAKLDDAIKTVSNQRAELGAKQNRLTSTMNNLASGSENLSAANSRVRDVDYAKATSDNTKLNILTQAGTSVLSQANALGQTALKLIG
jgi:flagellin